MGLISSTDYEDLPLEPVLRWLKLRDLLERRLQEVSDSVHGPDDDHLIEYCTTLISAARSLNLHEMEDISVGQIRSQFQRVRADIVALATRLSITGASARPEFSVSLPPPSKIKIIDEIEKLRALVNSSTLQERQKKKLNARLNDLHEIILKDRVDYAKVMAIIAYFSAGVVNSTTFLADAPVALATISAVIGTAKIEEDENVLLLEKSKAMLQIPDLREDDVDDDKIPF